jgi:hypothetical protein
VRHQKEAAKKEVMRAIHGEVAQGEGAVEEFMTGQGPNLRLAKIVKYEGDKRYQITFSEKGKEMLGEYRPKRSRNLSKKARTASRKLNRNVLPGEGTFVLVRWDARQAENNEARGREGIANIVAVLPKKPKLEEEAMKVANHVAKRAGEPKPWPLDELFERESSSEEESSSDEEENRGRKGRKNNSIKANNL